jgi:hypothetical protein
MASLSKFAIGIRLSPFPAVPFSLSLDEAHRFISHQSADPQIKALTDEIIDAVRTVRKLGMG